ncbi:cytochrome [Saccharothrix sp. ALI-22-I]|uniref:cytochrome P450 family protein n=1 Tax=Saccharothrix sp. ALI-22-I TaxID=1933778 RepID=UPI00097C049C|nr:cytochrome P450 [Saccharothrix sp. ALI-22-I]ONI92331.1 cytochrome [Saccharothrix sp. ALI-22-I]
MTLSSARTTPTFDEDFVQDLHSRYAEIREATPVQRMRTASGEQVWVVTRYADARAAFADSRLSKDFRREETLESVSLDAFERSYPKVLAETMLTLDPPAHTRLRKLVTWAFTPRRVELLRSRVDVITSRLLDRIAEKPEVDVLDAFAYPFVAQVLCEVLGLDDSHCDDLRAWIGALYFSNDEESTGKAAYQIADYLSEVIASKRRAPADDLSSWLIQVRDGTDRLDENELVSTLFVLLVAGFETTVNVVGNGVFTLLQHPDQWAALRANPSLVSSAVEEILRFEGPDVHAVLRHTKEPVTVGGVEIPTGEEVWLAVSSAHRDPNRYPDPDRFDITREPQHLAFGNGIHACVGARLARMEVQIALRELIERFPNMALTRPAEEFRWRFSTSIRALETLPVRLGP